MNTDRQLGWMWLRACELLERAERLQRHFIGYVGPDADATLWEPPVDVEESHEGLRLVFALPGVAAEDIQVRLEPASLTVEAVRRVRCGHPQARIRRLEIPHGRFRRRIALDGARLEIGSTRYAQGCLEVHLSRTTGSS